ncbi:MAG: Ku protein [Candidatus Palauibacterales bacterium]|nr:Ku protein [Candidatus Palauibacterales bacterium]MDP2482617.1 Ku protein [Candidatus Palauibacterales bacterium]
MSARPIASATVSFGLVSVPVKLYSTADNSQKVTFNWINPASGSRVRQRYWDAAEERLIEREELVKGYEFSRDQYVLFTPEELKVLEAQSSNAIEITEFIPFDQVERMYLAKAYYLGPDRGGERAYRLLSAALQKTGRAALARYAARGKEYLVLVRPLGEGLLLEQLFYSEELRSFDEVPIGEGEVKDEELALAVQLIEQAASDAFEPHKYEDEVSKKVMALIEKKIEGEEITAAPEVEAEDKIVDLMEALKASLGAGAGGAKSAKGRKPAKRASARASGAEKKRAAGQG